MRGAQQPLQNHKARVTTGSDVSGSSGPGQGGIGVRKADSRSQTAAVRAFYLLFFLLRSTFLTGQQILRVMANSPQRWPTCSVVGFTRTCVLPLWTRPKMPTSSIVILCARGLI